MRFEGSTPTLIPNGSANRPVPTPMSTPYSPAGSMDLTACNSASSTQRFSVNHSSSCAAYFSDQTHSCCSSFEKEKEFKYTKSREGWGLTNNGEQLIKSDGTERIWFLNPETLIEESYIEAYTNKQKVEKLNEWPNLEESLKEEFYRLEKANSDLGNDKTTQVVNQFRSQLDEIIRAKDVKLGNVLLEEISGFYVQLTLIYQLVGFIRQYNDNFKAYNWKDSSKARTLLNKGIQIISENPTTEELRPIVISVIDCLQEIDIPEKNVFGV